MSELPVKYLDDEAFREKLEEFERVAWVPGAYNPSFSFGPPDLVDGKTGVIYRLRVEGRQ